MWDILLVEEYLSLTRNKNIIITGTSSGIGKKLTLQFLKKNNFVWGCSRNKPNINHKNYKHYIVNLENVSSLKKWINKVVSESNRKIDLLICNAAIFNRSLNIKENSKNIYKTINTNLSSNIILSNLISKIMIKNQSGVIIFFSSVASIINQEGSATYAASKSGLETFSKVLAKELKKFNIKVHTFRIIYLPSRLSSGLKISSIKSIMKKFKTNIFSSEKKILYKIEKIIEKKLNLNTVVYDKKKN